MNAQAIEESKGVALPEPGTDEWREWRRNGIGGSEAAACVGMHKYMNLIDLVLEKRGRGEDVDNRFTRRGKLLEPAIRRAIEIQTGDKVTGEEVVKHPEHEWMFATIDARRYIKVSIRRPIQIKTHANYPEVAAEYGPSGSDIYPDHEYLQVIHEMAVTGATSEDLVVLLADDAAMDALAYMAEQGVDVEVLARYIMEMDLRTYTIERNAEVEADLIEREIEVWEKYIRGDETPVDITKADPKGKPRDATEDESALISDLHDAWLEKERSSIKYGNLKDKTQLRIGEDSGIKTKQHGAITWKKNKNSEKTVTDWKQVAITLFESCDDLTDGDWQDVVSESTTTEVKQGSRVFRVPTTVWKKEL